MCAAMRLGRALLSRRRHRPRCLLRAPGGFAPAGLHQLASFEPPGWAWTKPLKLKFRLNFSFGTSAWLTGNLPTTTETEHLYSPHNHIPTHQNHFCCCWFSGRWRALAKGTASAGLLCNSSSSWFVWRHPRRMFFTNLPGGGGVITRGETVWCRGLSRCLRRCPPFRNKNAKKNP